MSTKQVVATTIVFDYEYDAMGNPLVNARVEVRLAPSPQPLLQAPLLSLNTQVETVNTDANGYWQLALTPNSGITPAGTYYSVKVAGRTPYLINVPAGGGPVQAISNLVNQPSALAPATTNLTGPLTVAGLLTAQAGLVVPGGTVTIAGLTAGRVVFPGAGGLLTGDAALFWDNVAKSLALGGAASVAGDLTASARLLMAAAASKIRPGVTSISLRNNADNADNLLLTDAGLGTMRNALSMPPVAAGAVAPTSYGSLPVKIAEQTFAGAALDFNGIPAGFRHLVLEYELRGARATPTDEVLLTINADAGNNYGWQRLSSVGAVTTSTESGAAAAGWIRSFVVAAGTAPASMAGTGRIFIPNYAGALLKFLRVDYTAWLLAAAFPAAGQMEVGSVHGFWNNAVAITRIQMTGAGGNFASGVATLYGVP